MNLVNRVDGLWVCFGLWARGRAAFGTNLVEPVTMRGEVGTVMELLRGFDPGRGSEARIVRIIGMRGGRAI